MTIATDMHAAFLAEICSRPDDDAPRLIFADWLEEQGDAMSVQRAEFIRVQCEIERQSGKCLKRPMSTPNAEDQWDCGHEEED